MSPHRGSPTDDAPGPPDRAVDEREIQLRELELRREEFEHRKAMERRKARVTFSPTTTAVIAGVLSLLASGVTAVVGGFWDLRLREREQQFQIILRATEDRTPDEAAENLLFFVDIGYLSDDEGLIADRASRGEVPVITTGTGRTSNPLLERLGGVGATVPTALPDDAGPLSIRDGVLYFAPDRPVPAVETPNLSPLAGPPQVVLLHFTASGQLESSVEWFGRGETNNSAHVVIGRDGEIVQMAPFDYATWHAGRSTWEDLTGLNRHSVGIDLVNWGAVTRQDGQWRSGTGAAVPDSEVAEIPDPTTGDVTAWHAFTEDQLRAANLVLDALLSAYPSIEAVLGHSEVSPSKIDPGPAFPWARIRRP